MIKQNWHHSVLVSIITLIVTVVLLFIIMRIIPGKNLSDKNSSKEIKIAYSKDSPPFHFADADGKPAGKMIDLWGLWSEKTGRPERFKEAS